MGITSSTPWSLQPQPPFLKWPSVLRVQDCKVLLRNGSVFFLCNWFVIVIFSVGIFHCFMMWGFLRPSELQYGGCRRQNQNLYPAKLESVDWTAVLPWLVPLTPNYHEVILNCTGLHDQMCFTCNRSQVPSPVKRSQVEGVGEWPSFLLFIL